MQPLQKARSRLFSYLFILLNRRKVKKNKRQGYIPCLESLALNSICLITVVKQDFDGFQIVTVDAVMFQGFLPSMTG